MTEQTYPQTPQTLPPQPLHNGHPAQQMEPPAPQPAQVRVTPVGPGRQVYGVAPQQTSTGLPVPQGPHAQLPAVQQPGQPVAKGNFIQEHQKTLLIAGGAALLGAMFARGQMPSIPGLGQRRST